MKDKRFNFKIFKDRLLFHVAKGEKSNKDIAEKIGVKPATLSKWLNDGVSTPSINDLLNISAAYGCSVDYLVGNDNFSKPNLSARQICEMLLAISKAIPLDIVSTAEKTHFEDPYYNGLEHTVENGKLTISMNSTFDYFEPEDSKEKLVIDFFKQYNQLKSVAGLPAGTLETCASAWLSEIERKETFDPDMYDLYDFLSDDTEK